MTVANLDVTDIAFGGKGVGRVDGKAVFVPLVIDGEKVSVRLVREHKKFVEAQLETVQTRSPHRVEPRCPYFGRCGGCAYQHIDYEHQLALKSRQVEQTLLRIGGIANAPVRPIIASPLEYSYRNRITVHARDGIVGFFRRESNNLLDITLCPIASAEINARLTELRVTDPGDGDYRLRRHHGPRVFTQANDAVAILMLDLVDQLLESSNGTLIDAYCGAGFFAKRVCARFHQVIGIDWDKEAIALARRGAEPNESYLAGDVDEELPSLLQSSRGDVLIVDPPQTGLGKNSVAALVKHPPARLIYVSCNPATLARDVRALQQSFALDSITPLDMFPQTAEIEAVAALNCNH